MRTRGLLLILLFANSCEAESFCFAQAQSYYQQLYCEVKAKGKGQQLPRFDEFKRSNEITQALLLKRPARNAGVAIAMPKTTTPTISKAPPAHTLQTGDGLDSCAVEASEIRCDANRYRLLGNRSNKHLAEGALSETNRLDLPKTDKKLSGAGESRYLLSIYRHYLTKMMDIGLAGATMSYGKFEYLFHDLRDRGVDFYGRFETMYGFLKKDKSTIAVSEKTSGPKDIGRDSCGRLDQMLIACVVAGRNYLYRIVR